MNIQRPVIADDTAAIEELPKMLAAQKAAFLRNSYPSVAQRQANLAALADVTVRNRHRIIDALNTDYGAHPSVASDLIECLGVAGRAAYVSENIERWMQPETRALEPEMFGTGMAQLIYQPRGVIGNIVPWNFPFDLSLGPLADMFGAGNRVIIKPSEHTPACGELLLEMVRATFDRDLVDVVLGGIELSKAFPTMRWDHLLFTGSPAIGREVAVAAARNLVPVTLELGGKCPAIVAEDGMTPRNIDNLLNIKLVKGGQMCISVDYCMVPRTHMREFVNLVQERARAKLHDYSSGSDCTAIINDRQFDRLQGLLEEARASGAEVVTLDEDGLTDAVSRRMQLSLVVDPGDDAGILRDEVFGPIMAVRPYDTLDDAIDFINRGERPLAVYFYTEDADEARRVREQTVSGSFCHNASGAHGAVTSMGVGGVGQSGNGRHHGIEGFKEFSNPRGVFVRGDGDRLEVLGPPYAGLAKEAADAGFAL